MDYHGEILQDMIIKSDSRLSEREVSYISNKIRNEIRRIDDPCMDNFTFEKSDTPTKEYLDQAGSGCCGRTDIKIELNRDKMFKKTKTFYFGFNFGH